MKRMVLLIGIFTAALLMVPAWSLCAQTVKIGVIDIQKIMRDSKAAKKARDVLTKDLEAKRIQYKAEEDQTRSLEEEIKRDGQSMAPQVRQEKAERLEKEVKELRRLKSDLEEDFRKMVADLERKILAEVSEIAKENLKKEKFTVILEKRSVVAADESIDITEKVIRQYDAVK